MRVLLHIILTVTIVCGICPSCGSSSSERAFFAGLDSLIDSSPDSARTRLLELQPEVDSLDDISLRMRYELMMAEVQNKLYMQLPSDTAFQEVMRFYDKNSYFGMMVCLPHKDVGMNACMGQLDAAVWKKLLESLEYKMVDVRLPKYKMNKQLMLTDVLIKLGTGNIFLSDDAFARMTPAILSLDAVFQTSTIFVNEKGTEAAAVTGGWASSNGEEQEEHPVTEFKVDRPFFFCIYDRTIGTTLFMGAVNQL